MAEPGMAVMKLRELDELVKWSKACPGGATEMTLLGRVTAEGSIECLA